MQKSNWLLLSKNEVMDFYSKINQQVQQGRALITNFGALKKKDNKFLNDNLKKLEKDTTKLENLLKNIQSKLSDFNQKVEAHLDPSEGRDSIG